MTTETDSTSRQNWELAKARFLILASLVSADEHDGPLGQANLDASEALDDLGYKPSAETRAAFAAASDAEQAALLHHMETVYSPARAAAQALFEALAPDADAVAYKAEMLESRWEVCGHTGEPDAFAVISADAQRLLEGHSRPAGA
ncbi:hypothetical protein SH591_08755 [Sphingomonas sp. LY54]|uniref:hypothetical protein n=1 Tax=Sphingomonas sp. LY54 TaxID=3095343 RepID=UPI002D7892AF|nr:hypothetical protein [Sphingomonas sp. LY54]WRP27213.1 hypothetical protein SH591_08755 [Sphingomonas sp. LY54]